VFLDGAKLQDFTNAFTVATLSTAPPANGAVGASDDLTAFFGVGVLDEVRVATDARSDAWMAALYASTAGGFVTVGPAEPVP
jgi:hypothetical protein